MKNNLLSPCHHSSNGNSNCMGSTASSPRRHRRGLSDPGLSLPSATSRSIGQALALGGDNRERSALKIVNAKFGAGVVPEVEFLEVAVKVSLGNVVKHAIDAPLQNAERA